jgi:integrase
MSRHGTYIMRVVLPPAARAALGRKARDLRISLRTKNKARAIVLLARKLFIVTHFLHAPMPWEEQSDQQRARCERGMRLLREWPNLDLNDEFALDEFVDAVGNDGLEAYLLARDRPRQFAAIQRAKAEADPPTRHCTEAGSVTHEQHQPCDSPRLTVATERFIESKKRDVRKGTIDSYTQKCALFVRIVSSGSQEPTLRDLSAEQLRRYVDQLPKLPRATRVDDPSSVAELVRRPGAKMSTKTLFSHAQTVAMFLKWCEQQKYDLPRDLGTILEPILRKKSDGKRHPFSQSELQQLFPAPSYCMAAFNRPSLYWLPLLALFTGARQAELCQLRVSDVVQDQGTGIWVIDINARDGKLLKNAASARRIPIHHQLCALGWLDFAVSARERGQTLLFPDQKRNARGEFSAFSKWFCRYRSKVGIASSAASMKDFHSFRHTFQTIMLSLPTEEHVVNALVGHSHGKTESTRTYFAGHSLETLNTALQRFDPGICFETVPSLTIEYQRYTGTAAAA